MKKTLFHKNAQGGLSTKGSAGWVAASILIAVLSIRAVLSQTKDLSFAEICGVMLHMNFWWLAAAVSCMLGFIFFEACAIRQSCKLLNISCKLKGSIEYAAADIYFSAITPSASGGQPASACAMIQDRIPAMKATAVLVLNLSMYALSLVIIALICILTRPGLISVFGGGGKLLIILGCVVQCFLVIIFVLLIRNEKGLSAIGCKLIHVLSALHLVRDEARLQKHFITAMGQYKSSAMLFKARTHKLWRILVFNFLQRASQIAVTMCVYAGLGGGKLSAFDLLVLQGYILLGSNFVPIPGGMGVTDYLMLKSFSSFLSAEQAVNLEIISRTLSFYSCILVCGMILLIRYCILLYKRKETP